MSKCILHSAPWKGCLLSGILVKQWSWAAGYLQEPFYTEVCKRQGSTSQPDCGSVEGRNSQDFGQNTHFNSRSQREVEQHLWVAQEASSGGSQLPSSCPAVC
jgi:hypothetical protein